MGDYFGVVVRDRLIQLGLTTKVGNPDWPRFAEMLAPRASYETLRKAVSGERAPSPHLMEVVAKALQISPWAFLEYQLREARHSFDPEVIGFEQAKVNLALWLSVKPPREPM